MNENLNKNDKKLFSVKGEFNFEQFKDYIKVFKLTMWLDSIIFAIFLLFIVLVIALLSKSPSLGDAIIAYLFFLLFYLILKFCRRKKYIQCKYKATEKNTKDKEYVVEFYYEYFIRKSEHLIKKVDYSDIKKIIETDEYFHIQDNRYVFILKKEGLHKDQLDYIRDINWNIYECRTKIK